jgi:UDP-2,3-diacylglucosamine pyrophosphatase LpxH
LKPQDFVAQLVDKCHTAVAESAYETQHEDAAKTESGVERSSPDKGGPAQGKVPEWAFGRRRDRPMTMHATDFLPRDVLIPPAPSAAPQRHFPVMFLSDLHLGSRACRDQALLEFLQGHTADAIYLVGDIIDTWLPLGVHWTRAQQQVLAILLDRARRGTRLIYTPGNHDAFFRRFAGQDMLGIEVALRIVHEAADGRRYLVVHGDESDVFDRLFPRLSRLGTRIDSGVRGLIGALNRRRARAGLPEWALVDRLVKGFNDFVRSCDAFEERLADLARAHGTDGIICGHFHKPALHSDHGVAYANCGDWVENSTALVETASGRLLLIDWAAHSVEQTGLDMAPADTHLGFAETAKSI